MKFVLLAILMLLSRVAWACPNCNTASSSTKLKILGVLIVTPFIVAGVVIYFIRKAIRETS